MLCCYFSCILATLVAKQPKIAHTTLQAKSSCFNKYIKNFTTKDTFQNIIVSLYLSCYILFKKGDRDITFKVYDGNSIGWYRPCIHCNYSCLAKDHWRGFSTRNAHMVHIVNQSYLKWFIHISRRLLLYFNYLVSVTAGGPVSPPRHM